MARSNNTAAVRVDLEPLGERADKAFEDFNFGPGVEVAAHNGWSISFGDVPSIAIFEKTVFITLPDDEETDPTHAATFKVSFLCDDKGGAISRAEAFLRGESIGPTVIWAYTKITEAQNGLKCDLNRVADILDEFFGMTDSQDRRFVDSQSDAVDYLWRHESILRQAIDVFRVNRGQQ